MKCSNCQNENPHNSKFCNNCGQPLSLTCPNCQASTLAEAKFCNNCGHSLQNQNEKPPSTVEDRLHQYIPKSLLKKLQSSSDEMQQERKIITVLFCDVIGSTKAAEHLDPEEWAEIMNDAFKHIINPIYKYEGTIGRLQGDGVLSFFGAPISHEDDPQRAVLAGLAIIKEIEKFSKTLEKVKNFNVRVGINTGLAVVGEVGTDLRVEYTAMGNTVNLAARMEQSAESGTILIAESTYKLVKPFFVFNTDLGTIQAKGFKDPIPVYRPQRIKTEAPMQLRGIEGFDSPLVGRDLEYKSLLKPVGDLVNGKGHIVSLVGDAGLGKSRLIDELFVSLQNEGFHISVSATEDNTHDDLLESTIHLNWLEIRCVSYEKNTPYAPFIDFFTGYFDLKPEDSNTIKREKVITQIISLFPEKTSLDIVIFIENLLSLDIEESDKEKISYLSPPQLRDKIFNSIYEFIDLLASKSPIILIFDDLQWSDSTSFDLIKQIFPLIELKPIMLIGLYRPLREDISWEFQVLAERNYNHLYTYIKLNPLDQNSSSSLVKNLLHTNEVETDWQELILTKAEGNPFYVEEVIRSMLESKLLIQEGNNWRTTQQILDIAIPDTLAGVLSTRLDRLDESSKQVAQTASVIGREFEYDTLSAVYDDVSNDLGEDINDLEQRELIKEKERKPHLKYWFKHGLTQETAYNSLLLKKRRKLHKSIAEWFENQPNSQNTVLAHHFFEAHEYDKAIPYLVEAGQQAARSFSVSEAIKLFTKALDLMKDKKANKYTRLAYEGLGNVFITQNQPNKASENFQEMNDIAQQWNDRPMQASALNKQAFVQALMLGRIPIAEQGLVKAENIALEVDALAEIAETKTIQCYIYTARGAFSEASKYQLKAAEIGERIQNIDARLFGMVHYANTLIYTLKLEEGIKLSLEAKKFASAENHLQYIAELLTFPIPYYYFMTGDLKKAEEVALEGLSVSKRIGSLLGQSTSQQILGRIYLLQGRPGVISLFENAIEASNKTGLAYLMSYSTCLLGKAYLKIGNLKKADDQFQNSLEVMKRPLGDAYGTLVWVEIGNFYLNAKKDLDNAMAMYQKASTFPTATMYLGREQALRGIAITAMHQNEFDKALEAIEKAKDFVIMNNVAVAMPSIMYTHSLIVAVAKKNQHEQAIQLLEQALKLAKDMNMRPLMRLCLIDLSNQFKALNQDKKSSQYQKKAQDIQKSIADLIEDPNLQQYFLDSKFNVA